MRALGLSHRTSFRRNYLDPLWGLDRAHPARFPAQP